MDPVEKFPNLGGRANTGHSVTMRVCSGLTSSYDMPRQRIFRVISEFTKFATYKKGMNTVSTM